LYFSHNLRLLQPSFGNNTSEYANVRWYNRVIVQTKYHMTSYYKRRRNLKTYLTTGSLLKVLCSRTSSWTKLHLKNTVKSLVTLNSWDVPTFIEVFADGEYKPLTDMLSSDVKTIVDCGANIGLFSNWCSFHFRTAEINCHEPVLRNRTLGISNTSHLESVVWKSTAVSNYNGIVAFTDEGPGSTVLWTGYTHDVQNNVTIVDLMEEYDNHDIDILKMDIEGSEFAIIGDYRFPDWSLRVKCIALEWHNHGLIDGMSPEEWCAKRLEDCGYTVSAGNRHDDWSGLLFGNRD
jgi:FkbM family methyltransferase